MEQRPTKNPPERLEVFGGGVHGCMCSQPVAKRLVFLFGGGCC